MFDMPPTSTRFKKKKTEHLKVHLLFTEVSFASNLTDDGPGQCNVCVDQFRRLSSCTSGSSILQNQTCLTDQNSLGTTHCGSMAVKYRDNSFGDSVKNGLIRGCLNCTGKYTFLFNVGWIFNHLSS